MTEEKPIDLPKLKQLIRSGLQIINLDSNASEAVLVIGDTGVGKSTIMSFLNSGSLVVRCDGLKPTLDSSDDTQIKIGHQKYSQTSVPTKVIINDMAFYDCPGFKDNKGEQYQISNSFFVQRLLDLYHNVKLVLIIDQSHISEARADKLPKLIKNLQRSFINLQQIRDGVCIIINRASPDHTVNDYHKEIKKMLLLKNQNGSLFNEQETLFLEFLMLRKRIMLFRQAEGDKGNRFEGGENQKAIMSTVKDMQFVKSKHIQNILSESARLAIRDFIDDITNSSNLKIEAVCAEIVKIYSGRVSSLDKDLGGIIKLKSEIVELAEEIKNSKKDQILAVLQRELPKDKIQDFEEDFASIMFFKAIYDKTNGYFSNLINKIYSELSHLLTKLDKRIISLQQEEQQNKIQEERRREQIKIRQEKRQKEKMVIMEHCDKMQKLKVVVQKIGLQIESHIEQIKAAMLAIQQIQQQLCTVKTEVTDLSSSSYQITTEYQRIQVSYFREIDNDFF